MRERRNENFYFYCAFDICEKELKDFGVIGEITASTTATASAVSATWSKPLPRSTAHGSSPEAAL
jgi:hypothetical protein